MAFETIVKLPLAGAPPWLSHLELYREGNEVVIEVVKANGLSYAESRLADIEFNEMTDLILTRSSMEKTI